MSNAPFLMAAISYRKYAVFNLFVYKHNKICKKLPNNNRRHIVGQP